jgi:predicted neutral ceramidase superfamily lipid hydrolase
VIVGLSIFIVWVLRFDNIVREFKSYAIPDLIRNMVGATKIALATLLITGIWYPQLVLVPAIIMAILMACAQVTHLRIKNPIGKFIPSFFLMILSLFIAVIHAGIIN